MFAFAFSIIRMVHWFLLPALVLWIAVGPPDLTPQCIQEAREYLSQKFKGGYFG